MQDGVNMLLRKIERVNSFYPFVWSQKGEYETLKNRIFPITLFNDFFSVFRLLFVFILRLTCKPC